MGGQALADPLGVVASHIIQRWVAVLQTRTGEDPVQIRVRELVRVSTALAASARRVGAFAQQRASKPERQALLPDAGRPMEQKTRGQPTRARCLEETFTQRLVAEKGYDWHAGICTTCRGQR
jgi:hypothetical protein